MLHDKRWNTTGQPTFKIGELKLFCVQIGREIILEENLLKEAVEHSISNLLWPRSVQLKNFLPIRTIGI